MIRLIVANGDSYTQGVGLEDPSHRTWPVVLGDLLGTDHVNLARFASSNRRTVRSTVHRLDALRTERGLAPSEVLVITAWTELRRHEYYSATERVDHRDHASDRGWHRMGMWRRGMHQPTDAYFDHLWSKEGAIADFFLDWVLFDHYLRERGYHRRYVFTFPFDGPIPPIATEFARQLPTDDVLGGLPPRAGTAFDEIPAELPRADDGHPLAEGHAWFARRLADWITAATPPTPPDRQAEYLSFPATAARGAGDHVQ
ncbi:DUF6071 family protein [Streptomyces niger]|uniref:DUF6071 family protein n=1 Tax=Streptomyces niger TaxID=66373 RepID=UPI00069AE471|nr:DUF6071 family protein [Streptomyces niger]